MNENEKEIRQMQKRIRELAEKSYQQNIYTYSGFLSLSDQGLYWDMEKELSYAGGTLFGGNDRCERKVLRFGKQEQLGYEEEFPIKLLVIEPLMQKFADKLTHRDFLGAIMNLGIERSTIGDIGIQDNKGYVYCLASIAEYITKELFQIKHTSIRCFVAEENQAPMVDEPEEVEVMVVSVRIDSMISKIYGVSRSKSLELFRTGKVFVDGRLCENNSCYLKEDCSVTVRGYGKFHYRGICRESKKGKMVVKVLQYGK